MTLSFFCYFVVNCRQNFRLHGILLMFYNNNNNNTKNLDERPHHIKCHVISQDWIIPLAAYSAEKLTILFSGLGSPQKNCPLLWGYLTDGSSLPPPKWHLDRFSSYSTVHHCDQHTDRQTTLHLSSVAISHIYVIHALWPNNNNSNMSLEIRYHRQSNK